jgi:acetyl-CoA decarbonylase/synthase complex subunit delta
MKLAFEIPKQPYSGKIGESTIGVGSGEIKLGGEDSYPFYLFEGQMPNPPKIAMEIWDYDPSEEWPAAAVEPFQDVISSPDAWAKKCVEEYGADMIVVQMKSTDPNGMDRGADEAAEVVQKVVQAVDVPVIIWGTANNQKDEEVLKKISETCQGKNLSLGPVEEANHKGVGASAIGYGHTIVASSPIDVNLAKQLNILLGNLGVPSEKIIIDPTTGGLGYGLEYSYSVMERIRMAALTQEDDKLQIPMISNIGNEIWKCKEVGQPLDEAPTIGDPERRGILMESVAAVTYLLGGGDVVILRHPESVRLVRSFIDLMINGGSATDVQGILKRMPLEEADLIAISPEPNLTIAKEEVPIKKEAAKPKEEKAAPKAETAPLKPETAPLKPETAPLKPETAPLKPETAPLKPETAPLKPETAPLKPEAKEEEAVEEKPKAALKPEEKVVELKPKADPEAEAKVKAEAEAREKAEAEAKATAEAEAKAAVEAETKAKAEAKAKEKADLEALQKSLAKGKKKAKKAPPKKKAAETKKAPKKKAAEPTEIDLVERLSLSLKRMHKHS